MEKKSKSQSREELMEECIKNPDNQFSKRCLDMIKQFDVAASATSLLSSDLEYDQRVEASKLIVSKVAESETPILIFDSEHPSPSMIAFDKNGALYVQSRKIDGVIFDDFSTHPNRFVCSSGNTLAFGEPGKLKLGIYTMKKPINIVAAGDNEIIATASDDSIVLIGENGNNEFWNNDLKDIKSYAFPEYSSEFFCAMKKKGILFRSNGFFDGLGIVSEIKSLKTTRNGVNLGCFAISANGKMLAICNGGTHHWTQVYKLKDDREKFEFVCSIDHPTHSVNALAFSPDNEKLAICAFGRIQVCDLKKVESMAGQKLDFRCGAFKTPLFKDARRMVRIQYSPDGKMLMFYDDKGKVFMSRENLYLNSTADGYSVTIEDRFSDDESEIREDEYVHADKKVKFSSGLKELDNLLTAALSNVI